MADQDLDRMIDMHAEAIGKQLEAPHPVTSALEAWRDGKPRLVGIDLARGPDRSVKVIVHQGRAVACFEGDELLEKLRAQKRTAKRRRQRARAKARRARRAN